MERTGVTVSYTTETLSTLQSNAQIKVDLPQTVTTVTGTGQKAERQ